MAKIRRTKSVLTKGQQRRHTSLITFGVPLDELTADMCAEASLNLEAHFKKIAEAARRNLTEDGSVRTGLLRKAITSKSIVIRGKNSGETRVWAGVGIDRKVNGIDEYGRPVKPTKYAHLVEYGHAGSRDKRGKKIPAARAKPFMRRAIAATGGETAIKKAVADGFGAGAMKNAS